MTSRLSHLECSRCGRDYDAQQLQQRCDCGGTLLARYDLSGLKLDDMRARPAGTWRYRELLPVAGDPVSLGEPQTPLLFLPRLSQRWDVEVYVKDDAPLPGGTFKARGASVAVSRAVELGVKQVVMPTAGNAGGTWALYAARAGIDLTVVMANDAPTANRAEVTVAGAELVLVDGTLADAGRHAAERARDSGAFLAATFGEPYRLEGKKTAWLEVFDVLGSQGSMSFPRTIVLPVGGGVAALAAAKAVTEVGSAGLAHREAPAIVGVQASDCAPITRAFESGDRVAPWDGATTTIAAGLRVPAPSEGDLVLGTVLRSGGSMLAVSDDEIRSAIRDVASTEGVFACPEGATTVAAAERLAAERRLEGPVVLYNTGTGVKYVDVL